jgi:uncharacterized membrane protein YjdF
MQFSRRKVEVLISFILRFIMIILFLIALWQSDINWVFGAGVGLLLTFLPMILERNYHITLPWILEVLIVFALFLHIGGGVLSMYYTIPLYDKFAHFVSSFLVAFISFAAIYILDEYWDGLHMDRRAMAFVVIVTTMAFGVVWEFIEWGSDLVFGTHEQWGLVDTMTDLLVDTVGGILMALFGVISMKSGKWVSLTKDFNQDVETFLDTLKK